MMELLLSIVSGGATGLLGTLLSGGLKLWNSAQQTKHEIQLRKLDLEHMRAEAELAVRITEVEMESEARQAEYDAMRASYREASTRWTQGQTLSRGQLWLLVLVDVVLGLMRPFLTTAFVALTGILYWYSSDSFAIEQQVNATILYLATVCVTWWFGSRHIEKKVQARG